ncbi:swr complex subunit [Coemansia aciculifera]|nr:swr complex subunit [Coemansia aciculifera]
MGPKTKQKVPGMSRELTSLYLENQAIPVPLDLFQAKPKFGSKAERWVWRGFKSSARGDSDSLILYHWAKASEQYSDYYYARYNARAKPCQYTDEEYSKCIEPLNNDWTRVETDYLLHLCQTLDLRFIVVHDRYYTHPDCPLASVVLDRTLEDIKDRYYAVCRALTQLRSGEDSGDPDDLPLQATNKLADDLALLRFDKSKERERKQYLEALFTRSKDEIEEEEILIAEARRIEANERRLVHEREMLLQSHALFEEASSTTTISTVNVQFAQASEPPQALPAGDVIPKVRKGAPDAAADGTAAGGLRTPKKQKSAHGILAASVSGGMSMPKVKAASAANRAQSATPAPLASAKMLSPGPSESSVRRSASPMRAGSIGMKLEHGDEPPQFGPVSFATEEHLVSAAIAQVDTPDIGTITVAQRDTRLGPGVFLRSDKLHPIPKNKLDSVKQFMNQLSLNSPNTIWPRPVMSTAAVCDRFDTLQSTIIPLLEYKKTADKLETEVQVLRARKRMLVNSMGEAKAEQVLSELPPFDPSKVVLTRAGSPTASETLTLPPTPTNRHHRKGSTASATRKKA